MSKVYVILISFLFFSCDVNVKSENEVYSDQFYYYIGKNIESTDNFIRCVNNHKMDSMKYYALQGAIYTEVANHFYKLMYPNK